MLNETSELEFRPLLEGLKIDAAEYFSKAESALDGVATFERPGWSQPEHLDDSRYRDQYWSSLPADLQNEAKRLATRLISLMGQVARSLRSASLTSEADQRDVMIGTKAMRAALWLRRFRSWDTEILNDEDVVLGVNPPRQTDNEPLAPLESAHAFSEWTERIGVIVDLLVASPDIGPTVGTQLSDSVKYRPSTAFIMMWMDPSKSELSDVSDAVKEVFGRFSIRAIRADDIEHEGLITERILGEIKTSEFCFADLSGSRPNVYYEVGYAHALSRRVILYRKAKTGLHFDLAGYNCPEYINLGDLKEKLTNRLRILTNREPKGA